MNHEETLKPALIRRLVRYCHYIQARHAIECARTISSVEIASYTDVDESQVRKDLSAIKVSGTPRIGYQTPEVIHAIHHELGFEHDLLAVIVGAGHLGSALARYRGFEHYGLRVVAIFDTAPEKVNTVVAELVVEPIERLGRVIGETGVKTAILTVSPDAAEDIAHRLARAGIKAIWNFVPARFKAPDGVFIRHQHLSTGLAELAYFLKKAPDN